MSVWHCNEHGTTGPMSCCSKAHRVDIGLPQKALQPVVLIVEGKRFPIPDAERKNFPLGSGCIDYFPDALMEVAYLSWAGNEKHNPGEPLHDARSKSKDDVDCLQRHLQQRGTWDIIKTKDGRELRVRHSAAVAWRALRILQKECEEDGAPMARGATP